MSIGRWFQFAFLVMLASGFIFVFIASITSDGLSWYAAIMGGVAALTLGQALFLVLRRKR